MTHRRALLLEDDPDLGAVLSASLTRKGLATTHCTDLLTARSLAAASTFDVFILDLRIGEQHSLNLIPELRAITPQATILVITGFASIATTVDAIKKGADDYLPKPVSAADILQRLAGDDDVEPAIPDTPLSVDRMEWEYIQHVLQQHNGNISATARELNMHRRTLQRKLQKKPPAS